MQQADSIPTFADADPSAEGLRRSDVGGYALLALVSLGTLVLTAEGPIAVVLGGAATSAAYLYGFLRLNPRVVGIELIALTVIGYLTMPAAPTYWMMGSAVGGGMAAIATVRGFAEDHHFFLPPMAVVLFTLVLFVVGQGAWTEGIGIIQGYLQGYQDAIQATMMLPKYEDTYREVIAREPWETLGPRLVLVSFSMQLALWMVVLWFFNRFARRRSGRMAGYYNSLVLFRIRPAYTFLLIGALIFEILSVWLGQDKLLTVAYPLFAAAGVGFFMVYFGIVLFLLALAQASAEGPSVGLRLAVIFAPLLIVFGPLIGMADVWFDFRKIRSLPGQIPPT